MNRGYIDNPFTTGEPYPVVDTNVSRILRRYFGLEDSLKGLRLEKAIYRLAETLIPRDAARDFNFALLDFGAMVCIARNPNCLSCPLQDFCEWPSKNL